MDTSVNKISTNADLDTSRQHSVNGSFKGSSRAGSNFTEQFIQEVKEELESDDDMSSDEDFKTSEDREYQRES